MQGGGLATGKWDNIETVFLTQHAHSGPSTSSSFMNIHDAMFVFKKEICSLNALQWLG